MESPTTQYFETGASVFSTSSFQWRDLYISRIPAATGGGDGVGVAGGGAYHYQGSAQLTSVCRNRSIIWRYIDKYIELIELSWDSNLCGNALRLHLPSGTGSVIAGVTIVELASHVAILFATCCSVHRIILPHPETITKNSKLMSVGKGLPPSILMFAQEDNLNGSNIAPLSGIANVTCCASWCTMEGVATFVVGSSQSTALNCITLPPPDVFETPETFQLQHLNVIQKIWNILPMRNAGEVSHAPLALDMHLFGNELIILCMYSDFILRLWSVQEQTCVMDHCLSQYFELSATSICKMILKKSVDCSSERLRFAIYIDILHKSQIGIFDLLLVESQLVLQHVVTRSCPQEHPLVDMVLSSECMWLVSTDGIERHIVYCHYENHLGLEFNEVILLPQASSSVVVPPHKDPREGFLDIMFTPGHMTQQAISRGLLLYGCKNSLESKLRSDVIRQVEMEIHSAAGSLELTQSQYYGLSMKCWNKFYTCSFQYEQLVRQPIGLSYDTHTGMVSLIQQGTVSFLYPHSQSSNLVTVPYSYCLTQSQLPSNIQTLSECIELVHDQVSHQVFKSFVWDLRYNGNPQTMAREIAAVLLKGVNSDVNFLVGLRSLCGCIPDLYGTLNELMMSYDVINLPEEEEEELQYLSESSDVLDLFSNKLSYQLISCGLRDLCYLRLLCCIDLLVLCHILQQLDLIDISVTKLTGIMYKIVQIIHNYHLLYWLATTLTTPTNGLLSINLSELAISPQAVTVTEDNLMEICINTSGLCMQLVSEYRPLREGLPVHQYWTYLLPWLLDKLLKRLWPERNCLIIYESLLSNCQCNMIECVDRYCQEFVKNDIHSRQLLLGHSLIGCGLIDKGVDCCITAVQGLDSEPYLREFCVGDIGMYWIKMMRLLEQIPSYEGIVQLTLFATSHLPKTSPSTTTLLSNLFKYSLLLEEYEISYNALMSNTDDQRRRECLRHFVSELLKSNEIELLCSFNFSGMEEEVELVLDTSARSNDPNESNCYDFLYCYHMSRDNFWKAAHKMYEQGQRVMEERPCLQSLERQGNCYVTALTLLSMCSVKYQWIVKPSSDKNKCEIVTLTELRQEYQLVKHRLLLVNHQPSLSSHLCGTHVMLQDVCKLLNQFGFFEDALILYNVYQLSCVPVYEELTIKCVNLSTNLFSNTSDATPPPWSWLEYNETCVRLQSRGSSVIDQAWNVLRDYLNKPSKEMALLQTCVIEKLLAYNYTLPQWLIEKMKVTNIDKLLRLYISYNHLESALLLAVEYIDTVLGAKRELKNSLHVMYPCVWLPYNILDHLMDDTLSSEQELYQKLNDKLNFYKTDLLSCI